MNFFVKNEPCRSLQIMKNPSNLGRFEGKQKKWGKKGQTFSFMNGSPLH